MSSENDCWAAPLGGCSSKVSREHVVSGSLWPAPVINVVGFPWCKDKPARIGTASFVAKHLCTHHNSQLSKTDAEAKRVSQILCECARLLQKRSRRPDRISPVRTYQADGLLFERWLLKTLVNTALVKERRETRWIDSHGTLGSPPLEIIRVAFGLQSFSPPKGLYGAAVLDEDVATGLQRLDFAPLFEEPSRSLLGGAFTFFGHRFVIYAGSKPLMARLELPNAKQANWKSSVLCYRLGRMNWELNNRLSHTLEFRWGEQCTATDQGT